MRKKKIQMHKIKVHFLVNLHDEKKRYINKTATNLLSF